MLQDAIESFFNMRVKADGPAHPLPPAVLAELLAAVATAGLPADLLKILRCLEADEQRLPEEAMWPADEEGHTFLSVWLVPRYLRLRARATRPSLADGPAVGDARPLGTSTHHCTHGTAYRSCLHILSILHCRVQGLKLNLHLKHGHVRSSAISSKSSLTPLYWHSSAATWVSLCALQKKH